MSTFASVILGVVFVAVAIASRRALRQGDVADRAVALDTITSLFTCGLLVAVVITGNAVLVDVALILGLFGFLSSVTVANFIDKQKGGPDAA